LARSINTVAIRVMHDVGPRRVVEVARALGIQSELPAELSLALGSGAVTPLELTNAFATLAAGGTHAPPRFVRRIGDQDVAGAEARAALAPETAFVVVDMMRSVIEEGTATKASSLGLALAGKTGTTNDAHDAWFIGMSSALVVGVWVGFDASVSLGKRESGSRTALPIFVELMSSLRGRAKAGPFARPEGVVTLRIDRRTGLLAPPNAAEADTLLEVFVAGTEPTEVAPAVGETDPESFVLEQYGGAEPAAPDELDGTEDLADTGVGEAARVEPPARP
jgi:penicillin-binding protein 1A